MMTDDVAFDDPERLNTEIMRRSMTGMSDEQLATIGYFIVLWNNIERNLVACVWMVGEWSQETGEVDTADIGNTARADLLVNFAKQKVTDDPRLLDEILETLKLFDLIQAARNDIVHSYFNWRERGGPYDGSLLKFTAKRRAGLVSMKATPMNQMALKRLTADAHVCNEALNDIMHKYHFRKSYCAGERGSLAETYEHAVHGWRAPEFDYKVVRACLSRRRMTVRS